MVALQVDYISSIIYSEADLVLPYKICEYLRIKITLKYNLHFKNLNEKFEWYCLKRMPDVLRTCEFSYRFLRKPKYASWVLLKFICFQIKGLLKL